MPSLSREGKQTGHATFVTKRCGKGRTAAWCCDGRRLARPTIQLTTAAQTSSRRISPAVKKSEKYLRVYSYPRQPSLEASVPRVHEPPPPEPPAPTRQGASWVGNWPRRPARHSFEFLTIISQLCWRRSTRSPVSLSRSSTTQHAGGVRRRSASSSREPADPIRRRHGVDQSWSRPRRIDERSTDARRGHPHAP